MSEPKFWRGDKLKCPNASSDWRDVTVQDGPFRIEYLRDLERTWGDQPVYLCLVPSGKSILIAESALRSHWEPCPGEHRAARAGGWEKLES